MPKVRFAALTCPSQQRLGASAYRRMQPVPVGRNRLIADLPDHVDDGLIMVPKRPFAEATRQGNQRVEAVVRLKVAAFSFREERCRP